MYTVYNGNSSLLMEHAYIINQRVRDKKETLYPWTGLELRTSTYKETLLSN